MSARRLTDFVDTSLEDNSGSSDSRQLNRPFQLRRRGVVLRPDLTQPYERGGVLNPAAVLCDGITYLFYRAVAVEPPNYSRILMATCRLEPDGTITTTRLGVTALEPQAPYELCADGRGGVEDPRITLLDSVYYMAYTAYGTSGEHQQPMPRIALARSTNLFNWERMGLVTFTPLTLPTYPDGKAVTIDLNQVPNKDAILFPERIDGRYCLMHRPMFSRHTGLPQSIWISYSHDLMCWEDHRLVLPPTLPWESLKVGGGTPPIRTSLGWLTFYHGVEGLSDADPHRKYHAGLLVLDSDDPARVLYRSLWPVLSPESREEIEGVVSNVVFPTGVVLQPDGRLDVYYGMADQAIGLATAWLPDLERLILSASTL
jgi:predicted GH43/DUF377 family glycosyl hydrolase